MIKYAQITNEKTGLCSVGIGTNIDFYKSIGMTEIDVMQSDIDGQWYLAEKCPMKTDEEKLAEEQQRIALLSLTAADVERGIYKATGKDFDDIVAYVQDIVLAEPFNDSEKVTASDSVAVQIDIKALKIELKANNFYRGNPYVDTIGTLLGFTKTQLDEFFETGDYTKLCTSETIKE